MTQQKLLLFLFSSFIISVHGQKNIPPLDIPLKLSGTFGEFRETHFHAGIDIKTQGQEGLKVVAVEAGSIRRIRVATTGYGKCLYIQHANGTTSVYAHLQKFSPKIEAFVKQQQYASETFNLQRFLKLNQMTVEQGELIGYSGNTGGSQGPHLHFEIRDTKAETPLNPLAHGITIEDSIRPIIQGLYRYKLTQNRIHPKVEIPLQRINDSVYRAEMQSIGGVYGLGVRLFDRQDLSYSRNGIYKAELLVNGSVAFSYTFDKISFDDGKKINTMVDYKTYRDERYRIQKLFRNNDVAFTFLPAEAANGYLNFEPGRAYQIQLVLQDFQANTTYVSFYVNGITETSPLLPAIESLLRPERDYLYLLDPFTVYVPKETFYDPVAFATQSTPDTLHISKVPYPQKKGFEISVEIPDGLDSIARQQLCLAKVNTEKKKSDPPLSFVWTLKKDSILTTKYGYPGTYVLSKDSLPPTIEPLNFKANQWMSNYTYLKLKAMDDFSGIKSYRATINNQWILMEHEPKDKTLTFRFDDLSFKKAQLDLAIEIEDYVGNKQLYTTTIFRKPKRE